LGLTIWGQIEYNRIEAFGGTWFKTSCVMLLVNGYSFIILGFFMINMMLMYECCCHKLLDVMFFGLNQAVIQYKREKRNEAQGFQNH